MAEKTEVDMDLFSRRISPYFTWLESRIESGWKQSEYVNKDVLKTTRMLATDMRAKFILGVSEEELKAELDKTMELFELALDAFPDYSGEVENKIEHFTKGIKTELGKQFVHNGVKQEDIVKQPKVKKTKQEPKKIKKKAVKKKVEVAEPALKRAIEKQVEPEKPAEPVKVEPKKEEPKKPNFWIRAVKEYIFGED